MKKSLSPQEITEKRRENSIMLALFMGLIAVMMVLAFGSNILYVIAIFVVPVIVVRAYEEVNRSYSAQKPQRIYKRK